MIGWISGALKRKSLPRIIVDASGVGYEVEVSLATLETLPREGEVTSLEIVTIMRNESLQLFGFATEHEKAVFLALISVSGIGPRIALSTLSTLSAQAIAEAAALDDDAAFERVPGIGKKTAKRIVLELKDKLSKLAVTRQEGSTATSVDSSLHTMEADAVTALEGLGYRRAEVEKAVRDAAGSQPSPDLAALVRLALQAMAGR
ncbi:MAG: Holliday junction branch migration protein RuvA [Acidobacteria bacterium]|nr:Holliday junction branch migration protein RuvA [Acidobacteriota bacterium]